MRLLGEDDGPMDVVRFLLARLDEDEHEAQAAVRYWAGVRVESATPAEDAHIARHNPARVLAEVAAKRAIIRGFLTEDDKSPPWQSWGEDSEFSAVMWSIQHLAIPYADHPDYRQEWQP